MLRSVRVLDTFLIQRIRFISPSAARVPPAVSTRVTHTYSIVGHARARTHPRVCAHFRKALLLKLAFLGEYVGVTALQNTVYVGISKLEFAFSHFNS